VSGDLVLGSCYPLQRGVAIGGAWWGGVYKGQIDTRTDSAGRFGSHADAKHLPNF